MSFTAKDQSILGATSKRVIDTRDRALTEFLVTNYGRTQFFRSSV